MIDSMRFCRVSLLKHGLRGKGVHIGYLLENCCRKIHWDMAKSKFGYIDTDLAPIAAPRGSLNDGWPFK